jgi:HAE1 family hydrophobic/amphiphilic exporter-1
MKPSGGSLIGLLERRDRPLTVWLRELAVGAFRSAYDPPRADLGSWRAWTRERRIRWLSAPYALFRFFSHVGTGFGFVAFTLGTAVACHLGLRFAAVAIAPVAGVLMWMSGRFQGMYERVTGHYHTVLATALRGGWGIVGAAILLLVATVGLGGSLGTELIPEIHQGRFTAELSLPVGTPLERTANVVSEAERLVKQTPDVATVYTAIGADQRADARADEGEHTARLRIQLTPGGDLARREAKVMEQLRKSLSDIPRLQAKMVRPVLFSFKTPVEVVVFGYDLDILRESGERVVSRLDTVQGLRDVRSSLVRGHPEVQIRYDRTRLHRLGLDAATVAQRVRDKIQGVEATRIHQGDERISLKVQLREADRATLDDLERVNINPNLTPAIPLSAVADFEETIGPSEIRRVDQQRAVVVSANLEGFDLGSAAEDITAALRDLHLDDSVYWTVAGQSEEMQESLSSLRFALGLAIFLVYVIMASTFESLIHPLVILFSVPLAAVGAIGGLFLLGSPISVVVLIGGIVLAGVVVNNAIVLVDTINRLRDDGLGRDDAIRRAAALRVRPILITTATTVLGLCPLALGFGAGAEMQAPLAVTVIGGLLSSTMLTLIVIPVVYRLSSPGEGERAG